MFENLLKKNQEKPSVLNLDNDEKKQKEETPEIEPVIIETAVKTEAENKKFSFRKKMDSSQRALRNEDRNNDAVTVFGSDTDFNGTVNFSSELHINGSFEGTVNSETGTLVIGENSVIKAEIQVKEIVVHGKIKGTLMAKESVRLSKGSRVYGDIRAGKLLIEDGAHFVGRSDNFSAENAKAPTVADDFDTPPKKKANTKIFTVTESDDDKSLI